MSATPDESPLSDVDLDALDRCLSPLRRVLRYAVRQPVRYLDIIGLRWIERARALALPALVDELLQEVAAALPGLDSADQDEREDHVLSAIGAIQRIDRLLGLPLSAEVVPAQARKSTSRRRPAPAERSDNTSPAAARSSSKKRGRSRKGRSTERAGPRSDKAPTAPAEVADDGEIDLVGLRYGDEALGARPLATLHGAGPLLGPLAQAGLHTVDDLLQCAPTGEDVVQPVLGAGRIQEPGRVAIGGRVRSRWSILSPTGARRTRAVLKGAGLSQLEWPEGAPLWLIEALQPGARVVVVGEAVPDGDASQSTEPPEVQDSAAETVSETVSEPDDSADPLEVSDDESGRGRFLVINAELADDDGKHAVRLATYGLADAPDAAVRALVRQVLPDVGRLLEPLPAPMQQARGLTPLSEAIDRAHTRGQRAGTPRERLAFDEALLTHLALLWPRYQGTPERGLTHSLLHGLPSRVLQHVEVELTDEQQAAFEDVKRDLRAPVPMRRVLTGEVGAGRGLVALLSAVMVAENKHQVFILAPDQATAEQRYAFTEPLLRELGLVARLYTEPPSKAQRDAIKRGEVHVLFGATSLLEADIETRRLGLVIAGERDVFGRVPAQIEAMRSPRPDLLIITSTPVPQQVMLAAYPTFDQTVLRHLPGQPVPAEVVRAEQRSTAYSAASEAVERGEQVVVVFPMSRGADVLDVREALHVVSTLEASVFPGKRVKLFHGAMGREERYRVYNDFRDHRLDVLVATTHFEAGPAVTGVSTLIVEQADRMRQSRLHRVRGHLSVSRYQPRCWLVTGETPDAAGEDRVRRFAEVQDGFAVSAQELEDRGLRDMVADEPDGRPVFRWLDPSRDIDILIRARAEARALLEQDPGLRQSGNLELARYLRARWESLVGTPCPVQVSAGGPSRRRRRRRRR